MLKRCFSVFMKITSVSIMMAEPVYTKKTYSHSTNRVFISPRYPAPAALPKLLIAMYKVNCVAEIRYQHNSMAVANMAICRKVYKVL